MILLSKTLSGGHVPVAAVLTRKWILDRVFDRMERAAIHNLTFAANDLAIAAGLATLDVMESERLVENAASQGAGLLTAFRQIAPDYEMIRDVRGKGLLIGIKFGPPRSVKLRAAWNPLEAANTLAPLEQALATREVAAFIVEPIQGKTLAIPDDGYLNGALHDQATSQRPYPGGWHKYRQRSRWKNILHRVIRGSIWQDTPRINIMFLLKHTFERR